MTFKPAIWRPIAYGLSAVNLVGVGLAAAAAESWHAGIHAGLALVFGLWAERLRRGRPAELGAEERLQAIEGDLMDLRRELTEAQERLDFSERLLAQLPERRGDQGR